MDLRADMVINTELYTGRSDSFILHRRIVTPDEDRFVLRIPLMTEVTSILR